MQMKISKYKSIFIIAGLLLLIIINILSPIVSPITKIVITKKTDYKYETGLKITKDNQVIENYVFVDIPIGIVIWSSNNIISNCEFTNCTDEGILLWGNNNTIKECVFYNCLDGIELQRSSNNTFINCNFFGNNHAGIDGILDNNNNNMFLSCKVIGNVYGVYFKDSENNEFIDCIFKNNKVDKEERE